MAITTRSSSNAVSNFSTRTSTNKKNFCKQVTIKRNYIKKRIAKKYYAMLQKTVNRSDVYGLRSSFMKETRIIYPWFTLGQLKYAVKKLSASDPERENIAIDALLDTASSKTASRSNEPKNLITGTTTTKKALEECCTLLA